MKQRVGTFGPGGALVGILTMPADAVAHAPLMLLGNAGALPRQGPHRMSVRIARALADVGIASLRFDFAGHGDSQSIGNPQGVRAQSVLDMKSAMDWAARETGTSRFLIFGICSGAVNAYDTALADERIAGLLMFDGFWYRSRWTGLARHVRRAREVGLRNVLAAVGRRIAPAKPAKTTEAPESSGAQVLDSETFGNPPIADFVNAIQKLVDRETDVLFVYGGTVVEYYSYAGQFQDVFGRYPFYPHVSCEYHPVIDHTFISRHAQQRMIALICDWVMRHLERPAHVGGTG